MGLLFQNLDVIWKTFKSLYFQLKLLFKQILNVQLTTQYVFDSISYYVRVKLYANYLTVYCLSPPTIDHARHNALPEQTTFDLDSTLQYYCHTGYVTNGFPRAKCLAIDGQASWYGPDISCERKYPFQDFIRNINIYSREIILIILLVQLVLVDRLLTFRTAGTQGNV